MFSVEMAIFVEGTRLAQEYAVSPTFLILPAFVEIHVNSFSNFHNSQQKKDVIFKLTVSLGDCLEKKKVTAIIDHETIWVSH